MCVFVCVTARAPRNVGKDSNIVTLTIKGTCSGLFHCLKLFHLLSFFFISFHKRGERKNVDATDKKSNSMFVHSVWVKQARQSGLKLVYRFKLCHIWIVGNVFSAVFTCGLPVRGCVPLLSSLDTNHAFSPHSRLGRKGEGVRGRKIKRVRGREERVERE